MAELGLTVLLLIPLAVFLGHYMFQVLGGEPHVGTKLFDRLDGLIYTLIGIDPLEPMGWRAWARALLVSHLALSVPILLVFLAQGILPLNPHHVPGLSWDLALHTTSSFLTNTNQQHYSGQSQLSYFAQLAAVTTAQVVTPAAGLAVMMATLRGLKGGENRGGSLDSRGDRNLGNYWADLVRSCTRVLIPLSTVLAIALVASGVPATLEGPAAMNTLDGGTELLIPRGPIAPMVAIKQLGTNGGGWFGPNSAFPLENPTPISNMLELGAILLLPIACAVVAARMLGAAFGRLTFLSMGGVALALLGPILIGESLENPAFSNLLPGGGNWEGKEVRFGIGPSAAWAAFTTMTSNGSVNTMHDSLLPLSSLIPFAGMFINAAFGGVGVGVLNFILYVILGVFVGGLLIGRSPELLQRKLEPTEIRQVAVAVLLPPIATLLPTALALAFREAGSSNPGPHGLSQVLYEYASAAANNGSGLEGLADNTPWWNVSCSVVLWACRFVPMVVPLAVAGSLSLRRPSPVGAGTLPLGSPATVVLVLSVMILLQLLTFVPALVLGPIAEHLVSVPTMGVVGEAQ
jgi:K+-transporting ATPase ATPase A chain